MQILFRNNLPLLGLSLVFTAAGCGGGGGYSSGGSGSGGSGGSSGQIDTTNSVYVTSNPVAAPSSVLQFSRTANGSIAPTAKIAAPSGYSCNGLAVDASGNLYVGFDAVGTTKIQVYAPGANGTAAPTRTISGANTDLEIPGYDNAILSMDVDSSGNLYVGVAVVPPNNVPAPAGVLVFSPTASGNVAPTRSISMTLFAPYQLATDSANNLFVADYAYISGFGFLGPSEILVFNSSASGSASPSSYIDLPDTNSIAVGIAVDRAGNTYAATEQNGTTGQPTSPSILEFSAGDLQSTTPMRTISGAATTMTEIWGLRVDSLGNIYVLNQNNAGAPDILKFAANAIGNVAPTAIISSSAFAGAGGSIALQQ